MKCFNHHDKDAVAICKNCQKALCDACAIDVGDGIACRNSCEQRVQALNALQRKGENAIKRSARSMYGLAAFLFLIGIVFSVNVVSDSGTLRIFDISMIAVMWGASAFFLSMARKAGSDSH